MKIFYIEFNNIQGISKKKLQSALGRHLVKEVARVFYDIQDTEIIVENNKPKFKNVDLCFNISHSNNIVAVAFDTNPLGLDVEHMKDRNFKMLLERYNIDSDDKNLFYQFWTEYEASIKIQSEIKQKLCFKLKDDYILSVGLLTSYILSLVLIPSSGLEENKESI